MLVFLIITILLNNYGGVIDSFYKKFTTSKQFSIVLDVSRAMQETQPKVRDSFFKKENYKLSSYNFSFYK